ncbi:ferrous iron transport protein B [Treponema zioleckii]|uniref:ferrous iron transport protein B n=1 Tax=Treponema zioleckii TaxID=331680 RepID=UPI001F5B0937|nr:ferrous iron transport protein B [Treponema zioleckii]
MTAYVHLPWSVSELEPRASAFTSIELTNILNVMTLQNLPLGNESRITKVGGNGGLRQHFLDMGVIPGASVKKIKLAPMGDPMEIEIHGYELTLRLEDAAKIEVEDLKNLSEGKDSKTASSVSLGSVTNLSDKTSSSHPGLGEEGNFHEKATENPLPDGTILRFALVGNQNSGKTTLFNQLTGSNQHVGNFPGVTVDRKSGEIRGNKNTLVTDLPGIYSMSPYSSEELISRDFVLNEKPHGIINIVDATNIERNLYLTMQLLELNIPMVIALNMMDEVSGNGGSIDVNKMEKLLGVPVVPISASKNQGVDELVKHAIHVAHFQETPLRQDFCDENEKGGSVHRALHAVFHLIQDHAERSGIPLRFAASKLLEDDKRILYKLDLDVNEKEILEHIALQMEKERELDRSAAMADMRFSFIQKVCDSCVKKPHESKERLRSQKLDRVFTGKFTAIPVFVAVMAAVFFLTFNVIGAFLQSLLERGIESLTELADSGLSSLGTNEVLHGLIIDGIFSGVGSVLSFLPIIVTLFFFLSILEDSGYIARVAFVMDTLLRKIGLSGRSIVPLLIGFGCTVPAVMSTRILPSERDRKMTILLTPFMSCTAKLPIYAFFVSAFFPNHGGLIMTGLYLLGILAGILVALLYRKTLFRGEPVPFVMELPNYRLPSARNVAQLLWEKAKDFLERAFTVIFVATIVVWFLQSFDLHLNLVEDSSMSILAKLAGLIEPLFRPIGLGDWRICTSLISGVMAKESVVSTLEILFSDGVASALSSASAMSLLVFSLLYTPCIAAISSVKRELGAKWALSLVIWQCAVAWIFAFAVNLICAVILPAFL